MEAALVEYVMLTVASTLSPGDIVSPLGSDVQVTRLLIAQ